jgi:hypothetical protein
MTPCEHLFCEDALLEWLLRSSKCPVCNTVLDPESIRVRDAVVGDIKRVWSDIYSNLSP